MADKRQPEIAACFRNSGFVVYPSPVDYFSKEKREAINAENGGVAPGDYKRGVADLAVLRNGRGIVVEIKNDKKSFRFSDWRSDQREWAEKNEVENRVPYYLCLLLGDSRPDTKLTDKGNRPRKAWLIPRRIFLEAEKKVSYYQESIPYRVIRNHPVGLRDNCLDAVTLFQPYELKWENGGWHIPKNHILNIIFIER